MRDPCFITVWSVEEPQYFYQSIKKVIQILIFFKETITLYFKNVLRDCGGRSVSLDM